MVRGDGREVGFIFDQQYYFLCHEWVLSWRQLVCVAPDWSPRFVCGSKISLIEFGLEPKQSVVHWRSGKVEAARRVLSYTEWLVYRFDQRLG